MNSNYFFMLKEYPFQHGYISAKGIKWYADRWSQMDIDMDDVYSSDDENDERMDMAYEDALIRHKDSSEKLHKAKIRYKRPWAYKSYTVECPENIKKAIYRLSLPDDILKIVHEYIFPYNVYHVAFDQSLFKYRKKRDGNMNKTVERYIVSLERNVMDIDMGDSDPYFEFEDTELLDI